MVYPSSSSEEDQPILEVQNHLGSPMGEAVPSNSSTSTSSTCVENGFYTPDLAQVPFSVALRGC